MTTPSIDFRNIRQWHGSQHQAFEELCYQLRDPTPQGAELVKTGNPDGGLEWYVTYRNRVRWGWQAKYSFDIDSLLNGMEKSLKTVVEGRPNCRRLTFCIPFDLPDAAEAGKRKSARQRFEDKKTSWRQRIPGAERVRIELCSGGDLLERLVGHPGQRGIIRFFWNQEVFSQEWCAQRMLIAHKRAGGRYSPELHVDVPVAFALEGLALSRTYRNRFRDARNLVLQATEEIQVSNCTGLGVTENLRQLKEKLCKWEQATPQNITSPRQLERSSLLDLTDKCIELINNIDLPELSDDQKTQQQEIIEQRIRSLDHGLWKLAGTLSKFKHLLSSHASEAAANGALLLKGEAGQGKTHLFCDVGNRAVEAGQPAVVILGGSLSGQDVWSEIAKQVGLSDIGSEELISAMQAAAEASNTPFLLLVDALNEVEKPSAWKEELPRLFAEVADNPWISVAVSVRSTFCGMVLPVDGLKNVTEVEHPGFDGQELEATERFFDYFSLEQPRIPLLTPEFTNPLFLKLYCESLHDMGLSALSPGEAHLSQIFEQYLKQKENRIAQHLRIDPELRPARKAIDEFSRTLIEVSSETLPYEEASSLIEACGHGRHEWPNTLFGHLLSEGVLSKDSGWDFRAKKQSQVVRFTYQQFADYQVVSILLEPFSGNADSLRQALASDKPLQHTLLDAPPSWIEALAVLVPEKFGIELQDAAEWKHNSDIQKSWDMAFISSIKIRQPSAITERTCDLLVEVGRRNPNPDLRDHMLEALLSVATQPQHPLNAYFLHKELKAISMPNRDRIWSIPTYDTLDEGGPLDRLIRWASRSRRPDCPCDVVELAAITLAWTFTSPNRILRDCATKALSQLLSTHLSVLPTLIPRFAGVNDPYVIERLAVACHGAVLCGGTSEPRAVVSAADELRRVVFADDQVPNISARDAVRSTYEWCLRNGWVNEQTYSKIKPLYSLAPPLEPPTEEDIKRDYDRQPNARWEEWPYGSLMHSVFSTGDFGRYIIQPNIHYFIPYPLDKALPAGKPWNRFDTVWAQRWVFQRVISLGWEPRYLAKFDNRLNRWGVNGRTDHRPERFGKKYQWIALYELIARISDNFHMMPDYGGEPVAYEGPWQLLLSRDIDPTLTPPLRKSNMEGEVEVGTTFPKDSGHWWVPRGPRYTEDDPPAGDGWGTESHDIPEFEPLVRYKDGNRNKWVVLCGEYRWANAMSSSCLECSRERNFWSYIQSWLIRSEQLDEIIGYLEQQTLMGRWMPEGTRQVNAAYLGELPWAVSCGESEYPWTTIRNCRGEDIGSLEVCPAWEEYLWEDCSIEDQVQAWCPAPILFNAGSLTWLPGRRDWQDSIGTSVAQFVEIRGHRALLVREDWLLRALRKAGLAMVFGWLGEKQLFEKDQGLYNTKTVRSWLEINAVASLKERRWTFGNRRLETRTVR